MNEPNSVLGLATIRQNRGVSLQHIANLTKISMRCLEAIERGEFGKLPGGIYNTSYIRQYARAIDYDEAALLAYYHRTMTTAETQASSTPSKNQGGGLFGGFRPASTPMRS